MALLHRPGLASHPLFDLSDAELRTVLEHYAPRASVEGVRSRFSKPGLAEFGDLAREVGPEAGPKVLASLWVQARRGVTPEALALHFSAEIERYAELWEAEQAGAGHEAALVGVPRSANDVPLVCGPARNADSGVFRVKLNTTRVPALLVSYGSVRVDHYKRNSKGKYKDAKAARLEVQGSVLMDFGDGVAQEFPVAKVETNEKKAKASFTYGGLAQVPFVFGCGGVSANSPLWTCACSGNNPNGGDGGDGGFGGPGDGGIIDGG